MQEYKTQEFKSLDENIAEFCIDIGILSNELPAVSE